MKLRYYVDIKTLINVSNGLVYLNLHFFIINWGKAYPTSLQPLNNLHKRILRVINFSNYQAPFTPLYFKCNTLKIIDIYQLEVAKLVHNYLDKKLLDSFMNYFALQNEIYQHKGFYKKNLYTKLSLRRTQDCLRYQGALICSEVPTLMKCLEYCLFKKRDF